jgi:putative phosphoesterase
MKIGVLSDTHDRLEITQTAIHLLRERGAELILHCGDIESPETVRLFTEVQTHFVFGNWDKDHKRLLIAIQEVGGQWHEDYGYLELAGKSIAWVHGHVRGQRRELEEPQAFDYLFYGHSHTAETHRTGVTLVMNPGALFRAIPKTVALVDVVSGEWERLIIEAPK